MLTILNDEKRNNCLKARCIVYNFYIIHCTFIAMLLQDINHQLLQPHC